MNEKFIEVLMIHQKMCCDVIRLNAQIAQLEAEIENKRQWVEFNEQFQEFRKKLHRFAWHSELEEYITKREN